MIRVLVALGCVALFASTSDAQCGASDGSSSGGSSSGGSSGGGSSSSGGDGDRTSACAGDSPIVGESECRRFGSWDVSRRRPWQLGLDVGVSQLSLEGIRATGSSTHDNLPHLWQVADLARTRVTRTTLRLSFSPVPMLVLGLEGSLLAGSIDREAETDAPDVRLDAVIGGAGALVLGGALGIGDLRLHLDVAAGRRVLGLSGQSRLGSCEADVHDVVAQWTLRAGVGAEYFVSPWVSMALRATYDVLHHEVGGSLGVALHTRSYDAR